MKNRAEFSEHNLSRRERQIMAVIYQRGQATIADLVAHLPEPPTADAVRRLAHILEEKGHLKHRPEGHRNVYFPTVKPAVAQRSVLDHVMETFFAGSPHKLVAALLDIKREDLSEEELQRLADMIEDAARQEGRT